MLDNPKTIKIYLIDGNPTGTKSVEISNWTGKAYILPRNRLDNIFRDSHTQNELSTQGVYFLVGESEVGKQLVYVGEAENIISRIAQHGNKDFWNIAICFVSKDENLTKAHVKYLELQLTQKIKEANRVSLENAVVPTETKLPLSDQSDMKEFISYMEILLSSLGYIFTSNIESGKTNPEFYYCRTTKVDAKGSPTDEGFAVYKGSKISIISYPALGKGFLLSRQTAFENDEFEKTDSNYILKVDKIFGSPSHAAAFVLGRNSNGWKDWKTHDGKTLDEVKRVHIT